MSEYLVRAGFFGNDAWQQFSRDMRNTNDELNNSPS